MKLFGNAVFQLRNRLGDWLVPRYRTQFVEDLLPTKLRARTLYVVQGDGYLEQAAMECPCGCEQILHMNLLTDERPCWNLTVHKDKTPSLGPSIWRKKGCGSHFWLRRGRIVWCRFDTSSN